jgi:hypothetical protein
MFFAIFVYAKLTTLGDTGRWMNGTVNGSLLTAFTNSSIFMDYIGAFVTAIFGELLGNLPFMIISYYGIYYSVSKLKLSNRELVIILVLLSFPSFGIWSSIAGKEAVGVFFMGILSGYIIDIYQKVRYKPIFIEILAVYLLMLFKPQYSLAIFSIIFFIVVSNIFNLKAKGKLFLFLFHIIISLIGFYIFQDLINELTYILPAHFRADAGSTRENIFWLENNDFFINAPYGMFIAFFGPTFSEIISKPIQSIVFLESFVILIIFLHFIFSFCRIIIRTGKVNIYIFSIISILLFWILLVHYPFGLFNPGSAIRYRENFYGMFVVLLSFMYLEIKNKFYKRNNNL